MQTFRSLAAQTFRRTLRVLGLAFVLCLPGLAGSQTVSSAACTLTESDKAQNAKLTFDEFDQQGTTAKSWRRLDDLGCERTAAEAAEDYLIHAQFQHSFERKDVTFHMAQNYGQLGDYEKAAVLVVSARSDTAYLGVGLDWDTYLQGTWAFFRRNKPAIDVALARMSKEPGPENAYDSAVLAGLSRCFDKPYSQAYACHAKRHLAVTTP